MKVFIYHSGQVMGCKFFEEKPKKPVGGMKLVQIVYGKVSSANPRGPLLAKKIVQGLQH